MEEEWEKMGWGGEGGERVPSRMKHGRERCSFNKTQL